MDTMVSLVVKVLWKLISLICFRVYLEVNVHKNPTCFSRWSVREGKKSLDVNASKAVRTISKLSKGKKYYVKVRAYKVVDNKKIYGSYSKVKVVTIKKK